MPRCITNNDKTGSVIRNQILKRCRDRPKCINYNKPIRQDIKCRDSNEYSTIKKLTHQNIISHDVIDVTKPTTSKNSMSYSYHCALNGISSPKKVIYSTDSKLPIDSDNFEKNIPLYSISAATNSNLIDVTSSKMTNIVEAQKIKQKKDPKTNFISSILANFNNEKINLSKRTLISSLLVNADKFKLNIHTKHIDDLNQSNYNSISKTMNIQSKHSLTF